MGDAAAMTVNYVGQMSTDSSCITAMNVTNDFLSVSS